MKTHGTYKCEYCLAVYHINKNRNLNYRERIPPAKFFVDGFHLCGSHKDKDMRFVNMIKDMAKRLDSR